MSLNKLISQHDIWSETLTTQLILTYLQTVVRSGKGKGCLCQFCGYHRSCSRLCMIITLIPTSC